VFRSKNFLMEKEKRGPKGGKKSTEARSEKNSKAECILGRYPRGKGEPTFQKQKRPRVLSTRVRLPGGESFLMSDILGESTYKRPILPREDMRGESEDISTGT